MWHSQYELIPTNHTGKLVYKLRTQTSQHMPTITCTVQTTGRWHQTQPNEQKTDRKNNNWLISKHVRVFPTNRITTKRTNHDHDQGRQCRHLTRPFHLILKMTTSQVVETSVNNNNSLSGRLLLPGRYQTTYYLILSSHFLSFDFFQFPYSFPYSFGHHWLPCIRTRWS